MPAAKGVAGKLAAGIVLAGGAVAALGAGPLTLLVFLSPLYVLAYVELRRLLVRGGSAVTLVLGAAAVVALSWAASERWVAGLPWIMTALLLVVLVVRIVAVESGRGRAEGATADAAAVLTSVGIVGLLGSHVFLVRSFPRFGFRGALVLGLMVLLNDAFAFAVGRIFGRHALAPRLSPAKTWEGVWGGTVATLAVGVGAGLLLDPPFTVRSALVLAAIVAFCAPIGDLAQSALKRGAGVKDAAGYIPGHGGALDILDSLIFCAPAFYWAFRTFVL